MRIAVIDDEKYSRVALVRQIENFLPHAEIFEAGSGAQAVELLEKHTFDILFLDIHLGDMEGTTIAALARRLCRRQRSRRIGRAARAAPHRREQQPQHHAARHR